jgi:hypothetical protein
MDPLGADEIIGAANLLLTTGAARPGATLRAVDLREPPKHEVLAGRGDREAVVFWRQDKRSFKSIVNSSRGRHTPRRGIPVLDGQLGLTMTEVLDFSYDFEGPALLAALARRGLGTPRSWPRCSSRRSRPARSACPRRRGASSRRRCTAPRARPSTCTRGPSLRASDRPPQPAGRHAAPPTPDLDQGEIAASA